ncbi:MAG: PDZ domain-containing protein, partial [Bacteroidaceae bacterium]|nr:PDZ domain-containing protein [Bacteroidaceae bacterium]
AVISEPYEDMPALVAGVKAGDVILSIDGKDIPKKGDKPVSDYISSVSNQLRGDPNTSFILKVKRAGVNKPLEFKITRKNIQIPSLTCYDMVADGIGYICLNSFTQEGLSKLVRRAVIELKSQGAKKIIIDLRNNGGGLESEAVDIANLFVPKGKMIAQNKGKVKSSCVVYKTTKDALDTEIPLAVLVNSASASASEILSGSLQDLDRAVIIGTRTYGKGLVQVVHDLPYGGGLKVTTAKYYIPSGRCIQAIDYEHRNEDGSVGRIPDSLTTVYKTAAGREVRDGGGILPDIVVAGDSLPNLIYYMANDDILFDYANEYVASHPKPASAKEINYTDADYEVFKKKVIDGDFKYDRQSEKTLKVLKDIAKFEGYSEDIKDELASLEKKLTHNTEHDLNHFKKNICELITQELALRWFYQKGGVLERNQHDKVIDEAIRVLNSDEYTKILSAPAPVKKEKKK